MHVVLAGVQLLPPHQCQRVVISRHVCGGRGLWGVWTPAGKRESALELHLTCLVVAGARFEKHVLSVDIALTERLINNPVSGSSFDKQTDYSKKTK